MDIKFDVKTKKALIDKIKGSEYKNIRVKVAAVGCGKPAYDLYPDYISEEDFEVVVDDVNFVISSKDKKLCDGIEIKYDKEIYHKDFYVRSL